MDPVVVIGAGTMGSGIAHVCALAGKQVRLVDVEEGALARARTLIEKNLDRQVAKGLIAPTESEAAVRRIESGTDLEAQVAGARVIIEAAPERRELKAEIWRAVDSAADEDALLATNTSSISITWLASHTRRPHHVVGMHFFNPVPMMRLVEVVRGVETSEATIHDARDFASALGKEPVVVNDSAGFVSNRVLMPMINEAAFCVMEGVADSESVDQVMKLGMAHPMGPLTLADLIGLDVCLDVMSVLHAELGDDKYRPCPLLRQMVAAGRLGRKTGRGFFAY